MFSPIGNLPPSTYWRRRIIVVGAVVLLVLLLVLTIKVVAGGGGGDQTSAAGTASASNSSSSRSSGLSSGASGITASAATAPGSTTASRPSTSRAGSGAASTAPPATCAASALALQAAVGQSTYKVGAQPLLSLQVTNVGTRPCIQDIADKQVELRVYNGESRVWGSHDCEIQPGTTDRTLPVNQAVRVSIPWSARTSLPGCKGARQRVGAGTYTLYAQLAGKSGKAAQFTIS